jgi:cyanophycinase
MLALLALLSNLALGSTGGLFLVGGELADNNTAIYGGMVEAAGAANADVAVITSASEDGCCDPDSSWALYSQIFLSYSPRSVVWIPIDVNHTANNRSPAVVANLTRASLYFFSGGDQVRSSALRRSSR